MNFGTISRALYATTGAICLGVAVLGIALQSSTAWMLNALQPAGSDLFTLSYYLVTITLSLYALTGLSMVAIAAWRDSIILSQRKGYFLFLISAFFIVCSLFADLMNEAQGIHFGHLLLSVCCILLIREFLTEVSRRRRLALLYNTEHAEQSEPRQVPKP